MNKETVKNYLASLFSCMAFSILIRSRHMINRKFLLRLPFAGAPTGTLYQAGRDSSPVGKVIGPAFLSVSGQLHYFEHGDISRIEKDEYVMVLT